MTLYFDSNDEMIDAETMKYRIRRKHEYHSTSVCLSPSDSSILRGKLAVPLQKGHKFLQEYGQMCLEKL